MTSSHDVRGDMRDTEIFEKNFAFSTKFHWNMLSESGAILFCFFFIYLIHYLQSIFLWSFTTDLHWLTENLINKKKFKNI